MTQETAAPVEEGTIAATEMAGNAAAVAHDMSALGLFLQSGPVVQAVVIVLVISSIWSWAITIDKYLKFKAIKIAADKFEREFWQSEALESLYDKYARRKSVHPMASVFLAAMDEWQQGKKKVRSTSPASLTISVRDRIAQMMSVTRNKELDKIEDGLGFLATVGSSAPFVGLFGTVWGIMNSFTSIAASKNTTLAVVAPGIAEALAATAIGLLAAIPAVVAYNKFSGELARFGGRLDDFSTEFATMIGRKLDGTG